MVARPPTAARRENSARDSEPGAVVICDRFAGNEEMRSLLLTRMRAHARTRTHAHTHAHAYAHKRPSLSRSPSRLGRF